MVHEGEIFKIEAYTSESGKNLTIDWLESLSEQDQAKFATLFVRLADHGKIYNEQKFKHLTGTDQLFEFKAGSGRVISFFFTGKVVILTHGFTKKSQKTPKKEIERAEKIKKEFERRMSNEKN